jgi:hypothetical protein
VISRRRALAAGSALLAGCSSDDRPVLRFWAMGREGLVANELLRGFEAEHPGVTVKVESLPWLSAHEKLLTAFAGDATPDVAQLGNTWLPEFQQLGALEPLEPWIAQSGLPADDYFPGIWATNLAGGQRIEDHLGQACRIEQTQVHTLSGQRMHHMGGIPDQGQTGPHIGLGVLQAQGESRARPDPGDRPQPVVEGRGQCLGEIGLGHGQQGIGLGGRGRPDDRAAPIVQRQEGQRSTGHKALPGGFLMGLGSAHVGDQCVLAIAPAAGVDTGLLAHPDFENVLPGLIAESERADVVLARLRALCG